MLSKEVTSINLKKGKDQSSLNNEGKNPLTFWDMTVRPELIVP